ncbi:PfaD family polyunsaturated fatty acid/polyketide biosynthesis protein [Anaerolineales bacterium HSG25]|nr:PfaD family polyunsaturated fatty acid/polyketide biosynthesis protein [Anaerolineales bacterium HSG25]
MNRQTFARSVFIRVYPYPLKNSMTTDNGIRYYGQQSTQQWQGNGASVSFDAQSIKSKLLTLNQPCYIINQNNQLGVTTEGQVYVPNRTGTVGGTPLVASSQPLNLTQLGDPAFMAFHGASMAYTGGAMANGISSADLVIAMGRAGMLCSFGAAGMVPARVEEAIQQIQQALPNGPYAFNLIHSPNEDALERNGVNLYLKHGVRTVEASAYLGLTPHIVRYRVAGLELNQQNQIIIRNKVIAKISRREVATKFMESAPPKILRQLVEAGEITEQQANLAQYVPMADDITAEADSGGHTDNRPLVALLPSILALRDEIQAKHNFSQTIRVGAGGGIGTPSAALATFMMGAAYIVIGSVNQACVESGSSTHTKKLLAQAGMADVTMAPAADMFEMGVKLQVLKRGTFFPMRAQKLYDIWKEYDSIEDIPTAERTKLEKQVFRQNLDEIWAGCETFFNERDPDQLIRAQKSPKRKMALIFRWYLGLSSRWSNAGEKGRELDYQIWCGPAMGAFNDWVRGSYLEQPENRQAVDVAYNLMTGTAYLYRLQSLRVQGVQLPTYYTQYQPAPLVMSET